MSEIKRFRDNLRDEQSHWITQARDACNGALDCLEQAYDKRNEQLLAMIMKDLGLTYGSMCDSD